jgi:hydroxyacylglutathione hydrolase
MQTQTSSKELYVMTIEAFDDNYIWLIHDGVHAVVVDPGDAAPVIDTLKRARLTLSAILLTHHHDDHVGGVAALLEYAEVPVCGPDNQTITGITNVLSDGSQVNIEELGMQLTTMWVPGHTLDHLAYVIKTNGQTWLFCGDTLFGGGCGRLFEGTPEQMFTSLAKFMQLPDDTLVYCAHEYTLANLRFAHAMEPDNPAILERFKNDQAKRTEWLPTIPSTIGLEKATNPFLRCSEPGVAFGLVKAGVLTNEQAAQPVIVFAALRNWKNSFQ